MEDVSEMPVSLESLSEIQQMVAGQAVVVYSKSRCADSMQCKSILDSMEQPYTTIDLDLRDNGEAIEAALLSLTQRSVPNVFVGGQLILTRNSP
jgi:glutaredoxin 3